MMDNRIMRISVLGVLFLSALCLSADWPQFRGPNRDGKSSETGLLQSWPASGPALLWEVDGLGDKGKGTVLGPSCHCPRQTLFTSRRLPDGL